MAPTVLSRTAKLVKPHHIRTTLLIFTWHLICSILHSPWLWNLVWHLVQYSLLTCGPSGGKHTSSLFCLLLSVDLKRKAYHTQIQSIKTDIIVLELSLWGVQCLNQ